MRTGKPISRRPTRDYRAAERRGRAAELLCRWHLRLRGWRILASDWRCPSGEIDIIARRGRVLAAIEVKARDSIDAAVFAVTPRQRRRVARAFEHFLAREPRHGRGRVLRFDVVLVARNRLPRHVADAWRSDD